MHYGDFTWFYDRYWGPDAVVWELPVLEKLLLPELPESAAIPSFRSSCSPEHLGQLRQGVEPPPDRRLGTAGVDDAPGPAPKEHGHHPGGGGRDHVVVEAVAHVGDPLGRHAGLLDDAFEEARRGLLDAPVPGGGGDIDGEAQRGEQLGGRGRVVGGDPEQVPACPQGRQTRQDVGVEVVVVEAIGASPAPLAQAAPLGVVDAGSDDVEDAAVVLPPLDHRSEHGEEGETGDAQVVGPATP